MPNFPSVPATSRFLTLPNLLSFARLPLAIAFVVVGSTGVRVAILIAASLTDLLDGWLARRMGTTRLGALLDPIADKTFVLLAVSTLLFSGGLSIRDFLVVLSRDIATAIGFCVAYLLPGLDPAEFRARWPGKLVTVLQLASLFALLVRPEVFSMILPLLAAASAWTIADYTIALHRSRVRS